MIRCCLDWSFKSSFFGFVGQLWQLLMYFVQNFMNFQIKMEYEQKVLNNIFEFINCDKIYQPTPF